MIKTIADVCEKVYSGGTPSRKRREYFEQGTIPWLNTGEIAFNRIYKTENYITEAGLNNSSAKWVPANTVIVAMYEMCIRDRCLQGLMVLGKVQSQIFSAQ